MLKNFDIPNLEKLLEAINDLAPRDHNGELCYPYLRWRKQLTSDIAKWHRWIASTTPGSKPKN